MHRVHLDHNATTPVRPEVLEALLEATRRFPGNPSSVHASGRAARAALDEARERAGAALGVPEDTIYFTSGGTEANNLVVQGALEGRRGRVVTSTVEHSSVLAAARARSRPEPGWVPVDAAGRVSAEAVLERVREEPCALVTLMAANNETGTLQPVDEVGALLGRMPQEERPLLHTDAVQAVGRVPLELAAWGVDCASLSLHKLGGPRGVGILYKRREAALGRASFGGAQEGGYRPGTENLPGICAAVRALELAVEERVTYAARTRELLEELWRGLRSAVSSVQLLGPPLDSPHRLPNTLNVLFPHVEGRTLIARLDLAGLEASAGSACASGSLEPSHVLLAMGCDEAQARAGLRLSLGRETTQEDIHIAVDILRTTLAS